MRLTRYVAALCALLMILMCAGCGIFGGGETNENPGTDPAPSTNANLDTNPNPSAADTEGDNVDAAANGGVIPLNDEEKELIALMSEDVNVVTDTDWAETVTEIQAHPEVYSGDVYQLEGVYHKADSINGVETASVSRTLVNGEEKTVCTLPLEERLEKELPDGSWVRLTGFVQTTDYGGEELSELVVVGIETLAEAGAAELAWSGSSHSHT